MNDLETDFALHEVEERLRAFSRRASPDPGHKAWLRHELLLRHRELVGGTGAARRSVWSRRPRLKRLTLAVPPLVAAVAASIALLAAPMLAGHQSPQAAEAQRLTPALMRNVPTITGWQWTVRETIGQRTQVQRYRAALGRAQRVYVYYGLVYVWTNKHWVRPGADLTQSQPTSYDWEWAFSLLNRPLITHDFTILPTTRVDGLEAEGIRTTLSIAGERAVTLTFWVHRPTGLVISLERAVSVGDREIERDTVDYRYQGPR